MPFGSIIIGFLAEKFSAQAALLICGVICLLSSIFIAFKLILN